MTAVRRGRRYGNPSCLWASIVIGGLALSLSADPIDPAFGGATLERGMVHASQRIPELREAFSLAEKQGGELLLYGGTVRSLGFYVKKQLQEKGDAFFQEATAIPLEEVVGPYSDLDLIVRGPQEKATKIELSLRSQFPEGERFYRWEIRTEDFLKEPWQFTQGYEPISKILLGKDGFVEPEWRRTSFGKSLTRQGVQEILSGKISYFRNPRYQESAPYRRAEHHEILEAMRYLRFLHEFEGVRPASGSLEVVREIIHGVQPTLEIGSFLQNPLFKKRFETNLQKLQYSSVDNVRLMKRLDETGFLDAARALGYGEKLRVPLHDGETSSTMSGEKLGKPLVVYHGTRGYKQAWSLHRGGPFVTTYRTPPGVFVTTDRNLAKNYSRGEEDFILRLTLSPEARLGEDVIQDGRDVWIVKTRKAITEIEKPRTSLEVKWQLLRALAQGEQAFPEALDHLKELEARTLQESLEAARALATTSLPEELRAPQREAFRRLLQSGNLSELARAPWLANLPRELLDSFLMYSTHKGVHLLLLHNPAFGDLLRTTPQNFLSQLSQLPDFYRNGQLMEALTNFSSTAKLPAEAPPELIRAVAEFRDPQIRTWFVRGLAQNPSLPQLPEQGLREFARLTDGLRVVEWRNQVLESLGRNPSLEQAIREQVQNLITRATANSGSSRSLEELLLSPPKELVWPADGPSGPSGAAETRPTIPNAETDRQPTKRQGQQRVLEVQGMDASPENDSSVKEIVQPPSDGRLLERSNRRVSAAARRVRHEIKSFGKGIGIWMGALALSDAAKSIGSGKWKDIPGQLGAMVRPESLGALGLNYGSFSAAARAVEQPMLWMASKGSAQALKSVARFAGPLGFFAGSAVADWVTSGHLDLERWLVSGAGFLGSHALLNATVAPLIVTGLGLSSTGIGATVGVPILILAGSMLASSAVEYGYFWLKDYFKKHPEVFEQQKQPPHVDPQGAGKEIPSTGGGVAGALDRAAEAMGAGEHGSP